MIIPYGKQSIDEKDIEAVVEVLNSDFLTQGPKVSEFEKQFCETFGMRYALAVNNGTSALHLAYLALGVGPGYYVITTPNTFAATANAVLMCGGDVLLADIDSQTLNIDLNSVERLIQNNPAKKIVGLAIVDFAGKVFDLEEARTFCNKYNLWLLEDACHAVGGFFTDSKGQKYFSGNSPYTDASVFSFHPVKHVTTGEGGMITTSREDLYEKMKLLRTHGVEKNRSKLCFKDEPEWYYEVLELGYNYRITDLQCALGISQLSKWRSNLKRRREIAKKYHENLGEFIFHQYDEGHAYHLFVINHPDRNRLYQYLKNEGIYCQVHYIPLYRQPLYFRKNPEFLGQEELMFPRMEKYYSGCLSLPMFHGMTDSQQDKVIETILNFE